MNIMKKVQTLLAVFAVCILASCFTMQTEAAAGPFKQSESYSTTYPTTNYVYVEADTNLGNTISLKYSTTDPTVANGTTASATFLAVSSKTGKSVYVVTSARFAPASTIYFKYEATDAFQAVTAPSGASVISQTDASKTSVTLQWTAVAGATGYDIYAGSEEGDAGFVGSVEGTSHTVKGLAADKMYYVLVMPYKTNAQGAKITWDYSNNKAYTAPSKVSGVKLNATFKNKHQIEWNNIPTATGFEIRVSNAKGKKIATATTTLFRSHTFDNKKMSKQAYKVKVRAYVQMSNGKKVYGDWSKEKVCVPYATVNDVDALSKTSAKITWSKVTGAKSYTIYKASSKTGKYKKIKTVTGTSATLTGIPYKKIQYVYIKANGVKVGKKKYSTTKAADTQNYCDFYIY